MLNQDIIREATRLTRAGQLVEATALLQRMLRGESASAPCAPPRAGGRSALAVREPLIIDAKANAEEADSHPQLKPATSAQPAQPPLPSVRQSCPAAVKVGLAPNAASAARSASAAARPRTTMSDQRW